MSILTEALNVFPAIFSGDSFEMKSAFRANGFWIFTFFLTILGGLLVDWVYRKWPWLEKNLERGIVTYTYLIMAGIIFWGVIDRFVFSHQVPWSTTIPPLLFMIMAWFGCSYTVRLRTHLSFNEMRTNLPRNGQMMALTLDAVLWFGFCWIVITTTLRAAANSASNFQIVLGTDNIMQWWFVLTVPIAFVLMSGRVIGNFRTDVSNYRSGEVLVKQAVIGGDV